MVEETKKKSSSNYLTWTDEMDKTLLDVLVDQHNRGDHAQNGWKPHVYNASIKGIHDKCGLDLTKEKIWSRMKTFHKHYEVISKILSQSRFASYWVNNKLLIDSDDVWDKYVKANDKEACYKNKEVKNWEVICTIYSKDHATDEGAMTGAESEVPPIVPDVVAIEASPELPSKRMRTHDAILCMLGDMKGTFQDVMKSLEPLELPKVTPPLEILAAHEMIPDLARRDMLRAYGKLILSECLFQALMQLPINFRKEWLLMLPSFASCNSYELMVLIISMLL
ncbi:hypothetical protein ZWY2020_006028 [Hordeum vulgare]|nr:hypothetical protein ZWY2020_006028 [Hordeum vulgare]